MASLDPNELLPPMLTAAAGVLTKQWPDIKAYVESEFKNISESLLFIETQEAQGKMTGQQAQLQFDLQKQASANVLQAAQGLDALVTEAAINAALGAIKDTVNTALKFKLL